ncbi:MAG: DUF5939 domain-containing protein, partial [Acidimicrobiia bacterium]
MGDQINEDLLDERLAALESARSWSPRVISKLETLIRGEDEYSAFRVNPLRFAADRNIDEGEAIDLFLHAANVGLFEVDWLIVCAACANVASSFRSLQKVEPEFVCDLCSYDNVADLDTYIQVTFTISPEVRRIRFHDVAALEVEDLYFRYKRSADVKPLPSGATVPEVLKEWTRLLTYLEPGQTASVEFTPRGVVGVMDALSSSSLLYVASPTMGQSTTELAIEARGRKLIDAGSTPVGPFELKVAEGRSYYDDGPLVAEDPDATIMVFRLPQVGQIPAGPVTIAVRNSGDERASVWVVDYPPVPQQAGMIDFWPVLSAKRSLSNHTFRSLFRSESVPESETLQVKDLTYLFTDLKDSTLMYDTVGDVNAYDLVRRHFDALDGAVATNGGAVTKTIGDAIMATFVEPADGLQAAIDMLRTIAEFNRTASAQLALKIGLHRGKSLAVSLNDRIDYFGQEVNIAARVQQLAAADEIVMSQDVYRDPHVAQMLDVY